MTRRWRHRVLAIALVLPGGMVACSGGESGPGGGSGGTGTGGEACESSDDCIHWVCTCGDDSTPGLAACVGRRCGDGEELCASMCEDRGGLVRFEEQPSVKDSSECDAICAKVLSLGCSDDPRCDRYFHCGLREDECPDDKREQLACIVETGTWECNEQGGWSLSHSCAPASCSGDAGAE